MSKLDKSFLSGVADGVGNTSQDQQNLSFNDQASFTSFLESHQVENIKKDFSFEEQENEEESESVALIKVEKIYNEEDEKDKEVLINIQEVSEDHVSPPISPILLA